MTETSRNQRKRLRIGPLVRVLLPSLVTLALVVLLLFTMFFTEFDWQWVTFLAGILFASVLALVSASLKSGWRTARRAAEAVHFKQRLGAEIQQHRATREQLERELALHQQDRARLAKETEAHRLVVASKQAAESRLAMLKLHLEEIAVFVDRDRHCGFHTRRFAAWTGMPSGRIDGIALEEALPPRDAEALRAQLLDAMDGRAGRAELSLARHAGVEQRVVVDFLPQRDASGQVCGTLLLIREPPSLADGAPAPTDQAAAGETEQTDMQLMIADASGNSVYLKSLTEELSGWGNPRERIRQAIRNDGFDLYAQDIVALGMDTPFKTMHELLIRMRDEEQNLVPPGTFLPIAERFSMMPDIDRFVVRKAIAVRAAASSAAHAASAPVLCINLARASIEDRSFPQFVARALEQGGVSGQALCFEIADGDAIANVPEAARFAHELKPLGCRFTLDGFGRSGIGFDHVKTLPLDFLKIDGSIILQILRVPEALAKVRAIQRVCKAIGIRTIAEMVESEDGLARLRAVGVDFAQGFGIAPPRPFP
ncbi:MAG: EAL domain-containing protein [Betaproteobacteria bacterium]|nr:MAG: EAL domain-containing protein [Betaproteobacteria bacterium]